jgi:hypothetical protein
MKRLTAITLTTAATASLLVMLSPVASAATWSDPATIVFTDATTHIEMTCRGSTADMLPGSGTGTSGGEVTSLGFTGCFSFSGAVTLTPSGLDWPITASVGDRTIGETSGGHGISVAMSTAGCTADINGTGADTNTGVADFTYTHVSGKLGITLTSGNLHIYQPNGVCVGEINNGDAVSFSISYIIG